MKDTIHDANFPRTADQRVYHLGIRAGEVANRILTVGALSRAEAIAAYLDPLPKRFTLHSERGFTTITGRYRGTPISIISIGMGSSNADFFVREVRECLTGDMVVVRLGSCGALVDVPVGTVVVPKASISVTRNYDFDFATGLSDEAPYRVSKAVAADPELHVAVQKAFEATRPSTLQFKVLGDTLNASTDSFYSSQGRETSFPDHNSNLIENLIASQPKLTTFEMETFHILHLAASWRITQHDPPTIVAPLSTLPVSPSIEPAHAPSTQRQIPDASALTLNTDEETGVASRIKAAAAHMVFAARKSRDFITPTQVAELEAWSGRAVLEALVGFIIPDVRLHNEKDSVWEL